MPLLVTGVFPGTNFSQRSAHSGNRQSEQVRPFFARSLRDMAVWLIDLRSLACVHLELHSWTSESGQLRRICSCDIDSDYWVVHLVR